MDGLMQDFPAEAGMELPIGQLMVEIHMFKGRKTAEEYLKWYMLRVFYLLLPEL